MEMWLKQSALVLFTVTVAALVVTCQEPVVLNEIQKKLTIFSGSSLTLICNLTTEEDAVRCRVGWYFNPAGASFNDSHNIFTEIFNVSKTEPKYDLQNVSRNNSGWYFCKITVEIPHHNTLVSNGTQVVIKKRLLKPTTYPSEDQSLVTTEQAPHLEGQLSVDTWMWILLGVSAFTLIVLLIICAWLRRRCRRSREDPIYANTRPVVKKQPSPQPGALVNSLKTTASSENLRTPGTGRRYEEGKRRPRH